MCAVVLKFYMRTYSATPFHGITLVGRVSAR